MSHAGYRRKNFQKLEQSGERPTRNGSAENFNFDSKV